MIGDADQLAALVDHHLDHAKTGAAGREMQHQILPACDRRAFRGFRQFRRGHPLPFREHVCRQGGQ
jgi:hypothetical protein